MWPTCVDDALTSLAVAPCEEGSVVQYIDKMWSCDAVTDQVSCVFRNSRCGVFVTSVHVRSSDRCAGGSLLSIPIEQWLMLLSEQVYFHGILWLLIWCSITSLFHHIVILFINITFSPMRLFLRLFPLCCPAVREPDSHLLFTLYTSEFQYISGSYHLQKLWWP